MLISYNEITGLGWAVESTKINTNICRDPCPAPIINDLVSMLVPSHQPPGALRADRYSKDQHPRPWSKVEFHLHHGPGKAGLDRRETKLLVWDRVQSS
jgi:hypothetical protein